MQRTRSLCKLEGNKACSEDRLGQPHASRRCRTCGIVPLRQTAEDILEISRAQDWGSEKFRAVFAAHAERSASVRFRSARVPSTFTDIFPRHSPYQTVIQTGDTHAHTQTRTWKFAAAGSSVDERPKVKTFRNVGEKNNSDGREPARGL